MKLWKLFANHADAWGFTFVICSVCLFVHQAVNLQSISLVLAITACYWLGFALNDYFDRDVDASEPNKAAGNFFIVYPRAINWFYLIAAGVFAYALVVFLSYGIGGILLLLAGFLVMYLYSAPPVRLKSRPGLDLVTHAFFVQTFPYLLCLLLLGLHWQMLDAVLLLLALFSSLSAQLEQQVRDFTVDIQYDRTFTTTVGIRHSTIFLRVVTIILIVVTVWMAFAVEMPLFMIPFMLMAIPLAFHRFYRPSSAPRSERLIRTMVVIALAYTGLLWISAMLI